MNTMNKNFTLKKTKTGLGLFSKKEYKRGDRIIEYTGEKISGEEADRRGGRYLFEIKKDVVLDGKGRTNLGRYINHSCLPNAYPEVDLDQEKVFIYAKKKITPGDEITYNYGKPYLEDIIGRKNCKCEKCTK